MKYRQQLIPRFISLAVLLSMVATLIVALYQHAAPSHGQAPTSRNITLPASITNTHNSTPTPFMHRPYYGSQTISQRTTSFFDHDKPWYQNDGIFVRYDGARWTNVPIGSCRGGVNCYDGHNGYDLNLWYEPVLSTAAGTVIRAGWYNPYNHQSALGLWAAVDHGNGYVTAYGHLSALTVAIGDKIGTQWHIGTSGTTGSSTGPHLHMATYYLPNWNATDPFGWRGSYPDPNVVPDNYLWVANPGTSYTVPDLSHNGKTVYPGATLVDDGDAGWSSTGSWTAVASSTAINGDLHWAPTSSGAATATARWQPGIRANGYYEVGVFVNDTHASSSWAPYTIYSADPNHPGTVISHRVYVDESHIGSFQGPFGWENTGPQWISLGTYYFRTSQLAQVVLSNATGENGLQVSADGAEFVPISNQITTPTYSEVFSPLQSPATMTPGSSVHVSLNVQNKGAITWPATGNARVTLSYRWLDSTGHPLNIRIAGISSTGILPADVAPGHATSISITLHTPALAGNYQLVYDLQQQGTWFSAHGTTPLKVKVIIKPVHFTPLFPS